jgi:hypothetical protein
MKSELLDSTPSAQRRRWLGAISAAAAGLAAWAWHDRGRRGTVPPAAPNPVPKPAATVPVASTVAGRVLKPAPESVKRHG